MKHLILSLTLVFSFRRRLPGSGPRGLQSLVAATAPDGLRAVAVRRRRPITIRCRSSNTGRSPACRRSPTRCPSRSIRHRRSRLHRRPRRPTCSSPTCRRPLRSRAAACPLHARAAALALHTAAAVRSHLRSAAASLRAAAARWLGAARPAPVGAAEVDHRRRCPVAGTDRRQQRAVGQRDYSKRPVRRLDGRPVVRQRPVLSRWRPACGSKWAAG